MIKYLLFLPLLVLFLLSSCEKEEPCTQAPVVNAGQDTIVYESTSVNLQASSDIENGTWKIIEGTGGILADSTAKATSFTGEANASYVLVWESSNDCGIGTDTIQVSFVVNYTVAQLLDHIHWNQQASFYIEGLKQSIQLDPNGVKSPVIVDYVLITHSHSDHFNTSEIRKVCDENTVVIGPPDCKYTGKCKEFISIAPGDVMEIASDFKIEAVPAYNIVKSNHAKSKNWVGYVVTMGNVVFYHAGDTERIPEMKDIDCDIVMTPLGQTYTMNTVEEAVEVVKDVKANFAIPMHYGLAEGKASDAEKFKNLLNGIAEVVIKEHE